MGMGGQLELNLAVGDTESAEIGPEILDNYKHFVIHLPSNFDGTTIKFKTAPVGGSTWRALYDDNGIEVTLTVAASRAVGVDMSAGALACVRRLKLVVTAVAGDATSIVVEFKN